MTGQGPKPVLLTSLQQPTLTLQPRELHADIKLLLADFEDVFQVPFGLPHVRLQDHKIPLQDEYQVVKVRPYRYPAIQKTEIERFIREMIEAGIVRDSNSPVASPIVMVKKKDGSWRLCVNYRQLNQLTVKDKFPIPVIEELLDKLGHAVYFSKLDLRSGYHQIHMWEGDIHKTAFRTHEGHYEFLAMPFGLTNAPSSFQALMNSIFKALLRKFVLVFFDDILVYSSSWSDHLVHLREVLNILRHHQLYAKQRKCSFGTSQVKYLGHIISQGSMSMDPSKVDGVLQWPTPVSVKELRGFLGLSGHYKRFIRQYGILAKP